MSIVIDHKNFLSLQCILKVAHGEAVTLAPETQAMLAQRRADIENFVKEQDIPAYGFNRGFGHNVDLAVSHDDACELQQNLILSHAVGVGTPVDKKIVRIAMVLRANSLTRGFSGVRPQLVEALLDLLNNDITPVVPALGSVGASGDLAPLSHIAMAIIGKGKVQYQGKTICADKALAAAGLSPLQLAAKEGLALNNGVQFMNALGITACAQLKDMLRTAAVHSALVAQIMLAPDTYFRPDFHELRPHRGAKAVARWIWDIMQDSPLREVHKDFKTDGQVQDPYNIRCAAQILGSCHDLISAAENSLLIEANSATDNPVLLPAAGGKHTEIVSGGHFHGMPIAVQIYNLMQALAIMANLAHTRTTRFVDPARNKGLGRDLKWPGMNASERAISSGMMMLEYTSAALTNNIWGQSTPSHLFNIGTNAGQEDHVSMGTSLAVRLMETLPKLAQVLAIELAFIHQAAAIRKELETIPTDTTAPEWVAQEIVNLEQRLKQANVLCSLQITCSHSLSIQSKQLSPASEALLIKLHEKKLFPIVKHDRFMADEINQLTTFVAQGSVPKTVAQHISMPWGNVS